MTNALSSRVRQLALRRAPWIRRLVWGAQWGELPRVLAELARMKLSLGRLRVSFGPADTPSRRLGHRGWRVDPNVQELNRGNPRCVCDTFCADDELPGAGYDVVVMVYHLAEAAVLQRLREEGVALIYGLSDRRGLEEPDMQRRLRLVDGLILASPVQRDLVEHMGVPAEFIPTPIINRRWKTRYAPSDPVRLVWQGFRENLHWMEPVERVVRTLQREGLPITLVYQTNLPKSTEGGIEVRRWTPGSWEGVLTGADIGVVRKPLDDAYQQGKPATKVRSYMAAGLPVVCTPSVADRLVIEHGRTGYFAFTEDDWYRTLKRLVLDAELRERVGRAARAAVSQRYSKARVARAHARFFQRVLDARAEAARKTR